MQVSAKTSEIDATRGIREREGERVTCSTRETESELGTRRAGLNERGRRGRGEKRRRERR